MKPFDIEAIDFDRMEWREHSTAPEELQKTLTGCRIISAEPVDFPLSDEVIIYLEEPNGKRFAFSVAGRTEWEPLKVRVATLPD